MEGALKFGLLITGLALSLFAASAATAAEPLLTPLLTPKLEAEAYVTDCTAMVDEAVCRAEQARWSIVFNTALAGDLNAQKLVAQCLATGCRDLVTVEPNHACGWALVRSWATSKGTNNQLVKKVNYDFYRDLCERQRNIPYKTSAIVARQLKSQIYDEYRRSGRAQY
jgi:hypothetical protein